MLKFLCRKKNIPELDSVVKLLKYSFEPIDYNYDGLTVLEKRIVTKKQFGNIVKFIKKHGV